MRVEKRYDEDGTTLDELVVRGGDIWNGEPVVAHLERIDGRAPSSKCQRWSVRIGDVLLEYTGEAPFVVSEGAE